MRPERRYQLVTSGVATCSVVLAILVANHPVSQRLLTSLPLGARLTPVVLAGEALARAVAVTTAVMVVALVPSFTRPRRVLDVITITGRQVVIGCFALAAIGYLDYTFRLPRTTFVLTALLLCSLPAVFVAINDRLFAGADRAVIVGDDRERIERSIDETDRPIAGYVSPPRRRTTDADVNADADANAESRSTAVPVTDGGALTDGGNAVNARIGDLRRLGELSQLSGVLRNYDVERAVLAFGAPDRTAFFRALAACHSHGVSVTAHRECAESVLIKGGHSDFVDIDLEPWHWTSHILKTLFDKAFALAGLLVLAPLMIAIAVAIKLDSPGPVLYSQDRTTMFGETFRLYKFRTMTPRSGDTTPVDDEENVHITRVGRLLRRTHLDEIPQLYSILAGDMSAVGPRAAWIEEEEQFLEAREGQWRKRWFVKPGLTGLAQVNEVSSTNPELKLHYDIEYIRHQSFGLDVKIVSRQIRTVLMDLLFR